jgi:glutathione S-transferase
MSIEVFWGSGSPFSWRVLLTLALKRVPYLSHLLQFSKGENKTPAYLALNPRGAVPTLREGDTVISESLAIMSYLEARFPDPPLFGQTPAERGAIWQQIMEAIIELDGPADAFIVPVYFGRVSEKRAEIVAAVPRVIAELTRLERRLEVNPWLVGSLSAADVTVYPMVKSLARAASKPAAAEFALAGFPLDQVHPHIHAWMARIESLPGYEATYPPHWRS